ncbi:hypothetical protein [Kitasatospora sp. NPDC056731]|uniref:hypothetical protein n=1 Tax=Kitasatospora sp. NPDC056731 TaxID=3155422 RepID=UPI00342B4753
MTVADQPWTIERISEALGSPELSQRFIGEIYSAPARDILTIFAKWQGIVEQLSAAAEDMGAAIEAEAAGAPIPGEWINRTEQVQLEADRARARGDV